MTVIEALEHALAGTQADLAKAWMAIQRVRDVHQPWTHTFPSGLTETYCSCDDDMMFPNQTCATIRALDGDK